MKNEKDFDKYKTKANKQISNLESENKKLKDRQKRALADTKFRLRKERD